MSSTNVPAPASESLALRRREDIAGEGSKETITNAPGRNAADVGACEDVKALACPATKASDASATAVVAAEDEGPTIIPAVSSPTLVRAHVPVPQRPSNVGLSDEADDAGAPLEGSLDDTVLQVDHQAHADDAPTRTEASEDGESEYDHSSDDYSEDSHDSGEDDKTPVGTKANDAVERLHKDTGANIESPAKLPPDIYDGTVTWAMQGMEHPQPQSQAQAPTFMPRFVAPRPSGASPTPPPADTRFAAGLFGSPGASTLRTQYNIDGNLQQTAPNFSIPIYHQYEAASMSAEQQLQLQAYRAAWKKPLLAAPDAKPGSEGNNPPPLPADAVAVLNPTAPAADNLTPATEATGLSLVLPSSDDMGGILGFVSPKSSQPSPLVPARRTGEHMSLQQGDDDGASDDRVQFGRGLKSPRNV